MSDFADSSKQPQDMTQGGDADDFAAPQDLAGDDFAAELQRVLDEARGELNLDENGEPEDAATSHMSKSGVEDQADVNHDQFESLDEVIAQAPIPEAQATVDVDDPDAFEKQLQALLNAAQKQPDQPTVESPATTAPAASDTIAKLDEAAQEADAVTDQIKEMNELIARADAQPEVEDDNDDLVTVEQIARLMEQANAQPSVQPQVAPAPVAVTPPAAPESLNQLDEFLAGHADHAVADAFETVEDVVAQVGTASAALAGDQDSVAMSDDDAAGAYATSDELKAEALTDKAGATAIESASAGGTPVNATPSKATVQLEGQSTTTAKHEEPASDAVASIRRSNWLGKAGRIVIVCKSAAYRTCSIVNRPLMKASSSTRKTIGIIGLLTMGNASLLIFGKLLASLMG